MVFASSLPLAFGSDAADYATYILNRNRTKSSSGGVSSIELLMKKVSRLTDIVTFGSVCMVHDDARNRSPVSVKGRLSSSARATRRRYTKCYPEG